MVMHGGAAEILCVDLNRKSRVRRLVLPMIGAPAGIALNFLQSGPAVRWNETVRVLRTVRR